MPTQVKKSEILLEHVLQYENDDVAERIARYNGLSFEEARVLFKDTLTFLWLTQVSGGGIAPPPIIDSGWHAFILFTKDYAEFCKKTFGGFIHHHPRRSGDLDSKGPVQKTIRMIKQNLDPSLLSDNWGWAKTQTLSLATCDDCAPEKDCNGGDECK